MTNFPPPFEYDRRVQSSLNNMHSVPFCSAIPGISSTDLTPSQMPLPVGTKKVSVGDRVFLSIPHGDLTVLLELDSFGRFVRILEVRAARDFRTASQRATWADQINVDRLYED